MLFRSCDAYRGRIISSDDLKQIILHYANKYPTKLFNGAELNPTITLMLRKKRVAIVNDMLSGYQPSLF